MLIDISLEVQQTKTIEIELTAEPIALIVKAGTNVTIDGNLPAAPTR
jgi:hypothetical protein